MPTYLYGLILPGNASRVPRDLLGIERESVRVLGGATLAALVGSVEHMPARARLEDVKAHDAVLQAVVDRGVTTVAARFRQMFADDDDARRDVEEHAERVARLLREFDGCVEMRLLMRDAEPLRSQAAEIPDGAEMTPGRQYLEQLRGRHASTDRLRLAAMLGTVVRRERVSMLPQDRGAVFAHLVDRARVDEYRDTIGAFPALSDATIVGPLALYSFAEPEP